MNTYKEIADAIQLKISSGRLRPGDQLPTQRDFAWSHGIAASTAARVFSELVRRGLVVGEVGRGTFVRTGPPTRGFALANSIGDRVNLATILPLLPNQAICLSKSVAQMTRRPNVIAAAMDAVVASGTAAARRTVAAFMTRGNWQPEADAINFTGNGRQALAAVFAALVPPGQRLGVEAISYQSVRGIATTLGIDVVPLVMDSEGITVEGMVTAHRRNSLRAVYLQPTLHNPLGITIPFPRRQKLAKALRELNLIGIEDHVCAFLVDDICPLVSLAPDHVVFIDSLSKRVAPGLTLGWALSPRYLAPAVAEAIRTGALAPSGLALELGVRWITDGTVMHLVKSKRSDAARRQRILRKTCSDLVIQSDPRSYHAWIELPDAWRAETFTAAASERGIAIAPASAFAVGTGHAPNAVRVALANPTQELLAAALSVLQDLAISKPFAHRLE